MKDGIKHSFLLRYRITSVFLALIFLSLSAIQVFHNHADHDVTRVADKSVFQTSLKCDICDYLVHHHGKIIHAFQPIGLSVVLPEGITINTPVIASMCGIALEDFSNRGPPVFV